MPAWFELYDDDLWLRPDEGGHDEADYIRRALRLRRGQCVLDAPCGAGRVTWHLARRGIRMVGVDRNARFLQRARRRFKRTGVAADLRLADLRRARLQPRSFHAVFNWFNSFGYFSDADNEALVRAWSEALMAGGRLLIETLNRERILRRFRPDEVNHGIRMTSRWDPVRQRLSSQRHIDGIAAADCWSDQRLYTPGQLAALVEGAGLRVEALHGGPSAQPYRRGSPRLIVIARKPK